MRQANCPAPAHKAAFRKLGLSGTAVLGVMLLPASALAGPCDPPGMSLEDLVSFRIDPTSCAFAYYDYRVTPGLLGQHTLLIEAPGSLFREQDSGLASLSDFTWVPGRGWVAPGSSTEHQWGNVRVEANVKKFYQTITLERDPLRSVREYVRDVDFSSDANSSVSGTNWDVFDERGSGDKNGDGDALDIVLALSATVRPQPNAVSVSVQYLGTVIQESWVLDQCTRVPEPGTATLFGLGLVTLTGVGIRRRNRPPVTR
jgi:hypothetical protein